MERVLARLRARPWLVVAIAVVATAGGLWCASRLEVRSAFADLLPDDDPGVVALRRTQDRMGDLSLVLIGIRSPDPAANLAYAEALTQRLRTLPRSVCDTATYHLRELRTFIETHRWLYASEADLEDVRLRLRRELMRRKNPLFVDLGDDDDEKNATVRLEAGLRRLNPLDEKFPDGVFADQGGKTVWIAALPPSGVLSESGGAPLLAAAERFIAELPASRFHPQLVARTAGPVLTGAQNRASLERDVILVTGLCTALIITALALFFRSARAVLLVGVPAVLGTVLTYAVAYLGLGYITTVTAFLVAFVMGNGTNYAIVFLALYGEARSRLHDPQLAVDDVVRTFWRPSLAAAGATAASYLSLAVTSFRGFSQFGIMGAAGCLLAWLATFTVLPSILLLLGAYAGVRGGARITDVPLGALAGLLTRRPRQVLAGVGVVTVAAAIGAAHFGADAFEYDFRKLSSQLKKSDDDRRWDKSLDSTFGRWPEPTVILADRTEDVETIRAAIRSNDAKNGGSPVIGRIVTLNDLLPGDGPTQARKLAVLADIRRLAADAAPLAATDDERGRLDELAAIPAKLEAVAALDLPALVRRPFLESNGTMGRVLLVYPIEHGLSVWNGHDLMRISGVLRRLELPDGRVLETSGSAVVFASMIGSVVREGPIASVASLLAVCLLVLLRVRPLRVALLVLGALLVGVCWMVGAAGWLNIRITFLNFIALPFMFGVGAEYAINVTSELQQRKRIREAVLSMGGPVALCAVSAVLGYGSLLVASSGALRGLGTVATMGEVACLLAALLVAPAAAALVWRHGQQAEVAADARKDGTND
jgi:uncharacterized protein